MHTISHEHLRFIALISALATVHIEISVDPDFRLILNLFAGSLIQGDSDKRPWVIGHGHIGGINDMNHGVSQRFEVEEMPEEIDQKIDTSGEGEGGAEAAEQAVVRGGGRAQGETAERAELLPLQISKFLDELAIFKLRKADGFGELDPQQLRGEPVTHGEAGIVRCEKDIEQGIEKE
jgi:hypothetical protein